MVVFWKQLVIFWQEFLDLISFKLTTTSHIIYIVLNIVYSCVLLWRQFKWPKKKISKLLRYDFYKSINAAREIKGIIFDLNTRLWNFWQVSKSNLLPNQIRIKIHASAITCNEIKIKNGFYKGKLSESPKLKLIFFCQYHCQ